MNHYDTLGLTPDASPEQVRAAYRKARSEHHPDREGGDHDRMAAVNAAYETLNDPEQRRLYDDPLTAEAMGGLKQLFDLAVDQGWTDVLGEARRQLTLARSQMEQQVHQLSRKLVRLHGASGRVRAKSGTDLYAQVVERRIASVTAELAQLRHYIEVNGLIRAMLEGYEGQSIHVTWSPPV